jgi:DMSO/TMAO reductase YedYZ molybdopterin-dependent catalytic subunit
MRYELIVVGIMLLFAVLIMAVLFTSGPSEELRELQKVEVRDYEGKDLSSITDFRENSIKGPQYVDIENYQLELAGLVNTPTQLTYDEVLELQKYSKVVTLYCVEGWDATILWEGVLVKDLIDEAGGAQSSANTVIFHAYDGYTTSLSLDYILNNDIMIAYKMNDVALPPERGYPFQLVAEDKWGYKWIKWITKIELSDDPNYRGYWERAGYNNKGDLSGPKFET